jgi:hypothetical protein
LFAPVPGNDISSSMEQKFIKTRVIINKLKNNNTWLFILLCMQQYFYNGPDFYTGPLLYI